MTELEKKMSNNQKIIYEGIPYFHPGLLLKEILEARGIEQKDFAQRTGFTEKHISYILTGKSDITPSFAEKVAISLEESANTWMNLQVKFDVVKKEVELAEELSKHTEILKNFPVKEMIKNRLIASAKEKWKQVRELMSFFAVGDISKLDQFSINNYSIRYRELNTGETKEAKAVLFRWGEKIAMTRETPPPYKRELLEKATDNIRNNIRMDFSDALEYIKEELEKAGVIFIFTPKVSNAPASGCCYYIKNNPVIHLTYRRKQLDTFWFSLFHEIEHLLREDTCKDLSGDIEKETDKAARNRIISDGNWIKYWFGKIPNIKPEQILSLSEKENIPVVCIIGRLQMEKHIKYSDQKYNDLKENMEITSFDGINFNDEEEDT